jgi:hypothetical protein
MRTPWPISTLEARIARLEQRSRFRSWAFIAAFTVIIALTVAEGVDEGFSVWDWLVIAVGAVFILQALFRLNESRSAPT